MKVIENFEGFCTQLLEAGFTMGGENAEGIFSLCSRFDDVIQWHTDNQDTDPWQWRIRVLDERDDVAYAKVFFGKSGYISRYWYPCFLSARRNGISLEEAYEAGAVSAEARRIYRLVSDNGGLPVHAIKSLGGFTREEKTRFDSALVELQMKMFITMCGQQRKVSAKGASYGWSSTAFCTVEDFWGQGVTDKSRAVKPEEAAQRIRAQVFLLNPQAKERKVQKFIFGR